jgi:hypothetical protein
MGHCVGGYCDAVLSGESQVYTLRDKAGKPHVTIEVSPVSGGPFYGYDRSQDLADDVVDTLTPAELEAFENSSEEVLGMQMSARDFVDMWASGMDKYIDPSKSSNLGLDLLAQLSPSRYERVAAAAAERAKNPEFEIVQIKGAKNSAPKDEYVPFIQDFIRSGNFSDIGDLENAQMVKASQTFNKTELEYLKNHGAELKGEEYLTKAEVEALQSLFKPAN